MIKQGNKLVIDLDVSGLNARMYDQKIGYGQGALNLDCSSVVFFLNFAGSSKTFSSVIKI